MTKFSCENRHLGLEAYGVPNFPWRRGGNRYIHVLVFSHPPCCRWMEERMLRMNCRHPLGLLCCPGVVPLHIGTMGSTLLMSSDIDGSKIYTHCVVDKRRASWCRGFPIFPERSIVNVVALGRRPQLIDLGPKYSRGIKNVISLQFLMINK